MNTPIDFVDRCAAAGVKVFIRRAPFDMAFAPHAEKCAAGFHAQLLDSVRGVAAGECRFCKIRKGGRE